MSRYLIKLPEFLKPFFIELKDTTIFILTDIFNYIKDMLPKKQMIYSWTFKRTIPNFKKYFLLIFLIYFLLAIFISRATAAEKFIMPRVEMTEEEKGHDNALYNKVVKNIDDLNNKQSYELSRTITPKESANQNCYVSVKITQEGNSVVKKEILECADGRKGLITPGYWEMFAQFYYRDVSAPEYCRYYSRPDHAFKSFGKTCLNKDGEWRVQ
jgi:hypothetical protein